MNLTIKQLIILEEIHHRGKLLLPDRLLRGRLRLLVIIMGVAEMIMEVVMLDKLIMEERLIMEEEGLIMEEGVIVEEVANE